MADVVENLNVPKSNMTEFFDDLEGRIALLTEQVNYKELGLTLEDIRRPLLVIGLPGIGKTCGIMSIIKKYNSVLPPEKQLGFKKILLGQTVVGSLEGIPVSMPDGRVVRIQMPDLPDPERDGEYGVLFLDEITTADEMQIQPALGLADDSRNIGEYSLPEHWIVVAAGNGLDCTNFVRLDAMTISRFVTYDIAYNYRKDWRPYAHKHDINPDIIAFLNFDNDVCVRVEGTDMDTAGKQFPCPRTWERLSKELRMREIRGKEVTQDEMANFAGRIIGQRAANEFSAFLEFKVKAAYDPDRIIAGEEADPEQMEAQTFHLLLEACIKRIKTELSETGDGKGNYPLETYKHLANFMNWFLKTHELEMKLCMFVECREDLEEFRSIIFDDDFNALCPALDEFIKENITLIQNHIDGINNFKF